MLNNLIEITTDTAAASNEQPPGIEQVNNAVAEMGKGTQQNVPNAEENARASEDTNA